MFFFAYVAISSQASLSVADEEATSTSPSNGLTEASAVAPPQHAPPLQQIRQSSKESTGSSDTDSSSDDESGTAGVSVVPVPVGGTAIQPDKVASAKETEAGAEISALVNYVQPVHFSSFENSESIVFLTFNYSLMY